MSTHRTNCKCNPCKLEGQAAIIRQLTTQDFIDEWVDNAYSRNVPEKIFVDEFFRRIHLDGEQKQELRLYPQAWDWVRAYTRELETVRA